MRLGEKQELLARLLPQLLTHAFELGFEVRLGELQRFEEQAWHNSTHCRRCGAQCSTRDLRQRHNRLKDHKFAAIGILNSLHRSKLAVDMILFQEGSPVWDSEEYEDLGRFWKSLHELCAWGGDFRNPDGGHFSVMHGGRK